MERKEWTLGADDAGRRLDRILRRLLAENSQGAVLSALRKGLVRLNGKKAQASDLTSRGDLLSVAAFLLAQIPEAPFAPSQKGKQGQKAPPKKFSSHKKGPPRFGAAAILVLQTSPARLRQTLILSRRGFPCQTQDFRGGMSEEAWERPRCP